MVVILLGWMKWCSSEVGCVLWKKWVVVLLKFRFCCVVSVLKKVCVFLVSVGLGSMLLIVMVVLV